MNNPIRILYVDDYPLDRELVRDALEREHGGFELVEAASREDFETRLTQGGFELILSDFNILGFEGLQVIDTVRAAGLDVPVIIVTGTGSEEVAAEAIKRGAADYVLKTPQQILRLPHIIRSVLEKRQLETKRKLAEEKLRESEDKFKYVFDHSAAGKSFTLPSGALNVNQAFCDMVGYSAEELKNRKWQMITHPEDVELTNKANEAMLSGKKDSMRFVKRFIHKNGSIVWADVATALRRDKNGKPLYFMTTFLDITERKRGEEKLTKERILLETVINNLPDHIYAMDVQGRKTLSNVADWRASGGNSMEEVLGKTDLETYPPELAVKYWALDKAVIDTGISINNQEEPGLDSKGNPVWLLSSKVPLRDHHGNIIGLVGIGRNITERKRAEEALRQSEAELRALFASMHDIVMVIDREGVYRKFAPTNPELLIKPPEELLGKSLRNVFPKEQAEAFMGVLQEVLETKQPTQIDYDLPIGDRVVQFEASIAPLTEDTTLWVAHDITARKKAEEKIRTLNAELEQRVEERTRELRQAQDKIVQQEKLAVLGQLAGGVGHELRNPLGIISNAIYYLKMIQPDADEKVKEYQALISREVRNSEKIITDLLDFSRLESMERNPVSVVELVQWTLMRFTVPEGIKTTLKLPEDLPEVYVDMGQMQQVLGNLVDNACQAILPPMPSRKGETRRTKSSQREMPPLEIRTGASAKGAVKAGTLTISARPLKGRVAISVKDTGVGITSENLPRIFEPLFTTKTKGIGLGLAVSKKLAEANGGRIEVKSELGKGSTFTLFLPTERE